MDNPAREYQHSNSIDVFGFDHVLLPTFSDRNLVENLFEPSNVVDSNHHQFYFLPNDPNNRGNLAPSEGNVSEAVLKCISQMLMEDEDLENRLGVVENSLALQEAEKSLYDVLGEKYPPSPDRNRGKPDEKVHIPDDDWSGTCSSHGISSSGSVNNVDYSNLIGDQNKFGSYHNFGYATRSNSSSGLCDGVRGTMGFLIDSFQVLVPSNESQAISQFSGGEGKFSLVVPEEDRENCDLEQKYKNLRLLLDVEENSKGSSQCKSRGKKSHYREDAECLEEEGSSNKQLAGCADDCDEQLEMYDEVLLCPALNSHLQESSACFCIEGLQSSKNWQSNGMRRGRPRGKKQGRKREVVDFMRLLTQCAQAVGNNDSRPANELLKQIRQHSSPSGDATERMAHYVANALEARLAGTGRAVDASFMTTRISAADTLKAYSTFLTALPFKRMSNFFANKSIWKLAEKATRLHIIDFGIIHGFQWPHLIHHLSQRTGEPPKVRITGIDFPQPGFRPAQRAEETGRRLAYYCGKFNVPFEYNAIAKKWHTIQIEDLNIQKNEVLLVNCLFRLQYIPDETVEVNSPRDAVLNLIRRINPDLFIHGIINGSYSGPFFVTRFRETLFQSHAAFDMFDAVLPRDDQGRMLYEREVLGRGVMSVIACEGTERVIRPETYKQWQARNLRAGFKQLPLDREIIENVKTKVKLGYHQDFLVDEDRNWMLLGWKGRILSALSCWKPA
ncbi:scarecrow-like protein 30 [Diospyros lotus]|uniref:scarecrow-like protein 30 n=1 Tax=Diospyros lotus TaxID=55363 RepID=UPI002252F10B|nr:scarecrow-like protein 30 [Diospyros lotus]XP_052178657.1 scarecrow-like protein 30 [Diospyros lotus]